MAGLDGFDASVIKPDAGRDLLPDGEYLVVIAESERKENQAGTGEYLMLKFQVITGPYKERNLWECLNIVHQKQVVREIAQGKLSAVCHAVGVLQPKDSVDLHDLPLKIKVAQKKDKNTGEMRNVIQSFKSKSETTAKSESFTANSGGAPWQK